MRAVLALAVLPALLVAPVARDRALAESDRYTVLGFVTDDGAARGTRIDLEGARWVERSAWFRSTLARILAPRTH
jgi:hypothetical protein